MIFAGKNGVLVYLFLMHEMNAHSLYSDKKWAVLSEVSRKWVQSERDGVSLSGWFTVEPEDTRPLSLPRNSLIAKDLHRFKEKLDKCLGKKSVENH